MSPSYADTVKLVKDNYFHWEFNMRMKLARKGLLPQIVKPEYDQLYDRSTAEWKTKDLKALEQFNRKTLKNRLVVTKMLNNFKMEPGTRFANHVDQLKEIVLQMETIEEPLDEARQLVLLLGSLTDEYKMISTVLENTPNITLAYAIQALSGVTASDESPSAHEKAFAARKRNSGGNHRFGGKCFYCKKQGNKEFECRKKKSDEERGQVAQEERHDFAFAATGAMSRSEWLVDSGASSRMTSVRDMFVSMKDLKTPVRTTIADGTKIDAVVTGTVRLKLMDGKTVSLSDVLYIPEVEGSLISESKLVEKNVVAQFSKHKCVFHYGDAKVMEAMRCGNVYKLKTVGDEVCNVAMTPRKEPWAVVHARLGRIPLKRYEQLLTMADGVPEVADGVNSDAICAGCCMGKMRADDFPRYPEKLVKSAGVLDLVHTDVMGPMQTKTSGGCTYVVTFIDDYSRHVTVYFMKAKSDVLSKFKIFKAALENATGQRIKRLRSDNGGEYTGRQFEAYLNNCGIKHEKTVPYAPQQNGLAERMNWSLVEMARCMLYHESVDKKW
ncbi:Integrase catalytic core protein, partial [Phytophthora palmivora]